MADKPKRPRDAQRAKVAAAVHVTGGAVYYKADGLDQVRRLFGVAHHRAVVRLLGTRPAIPPVALGRATRGTAAGVTLDRHVLYFHYVRLLALLAEHLAHRFHPADEPLHGWRYAKLLLALVEVGCGEKVAGHLRSAYVTYKVRHKAPRRTKPASPEEIERLRGLRTAVALRRLFGELHNPPGETT